ncbi:hypothetical protein ACFQ15_16015 [Sphingomonas hankookensis]|uniref:hypothetical protein n=1 Tax=Sphingomonas hankookensis TaxID=563996 RepID=UPI001F58BDA3|nr:hypothetical protein [Sphingomonas hankookensis]
MLSGIFDAGSQGDPTTGGSEISDADGGALAAGLSVDQGVALELDLSNEMGGSYQGLDGSETTWSREDSLGLDVDTSVLLSGDAGIEG